MKIINPLFIFLASVMISCNGKFEQTTNDSEITVAASVIETRAGYEGTTNLPSAFVMDIDQSGSNYDYSLVTMTKKYTNEYTPNTKMLWADKNHSDVEIKAMTIPYGFTDVDVDAVSPMRISVSVEQDKKVNVVASDLLGATSSNGISVNENVVNIEFSHLLSKLEVTYEVGPEFQNSIFIIKSLVLQNICTEGGFSYHNMDLDSSVERVYGEISMYHDSSNKTAEAIFYPYKPATNPVLFMVVTSNNTEYTLKCPIVLNSDAGFVGGRKYKVRVGIMGSTISQTSAAIADGWHTDTDDQNFVTE